MTMNEAMSTLESSKNPNSDELCETASEAGASSNNTNINAEAPSLEELLNTLHRQIRKSDWLEKNTAEKWMNENPEAAKDLLQIISEKKVASQSSSESSEQK